MKVYFNTTNLRGEALQDARANAQSQKKRIFLIFLEQYVKDKHKPEPRRGLIGPSGVHSKYEHLYRDVPITSIRRAINVLTTEGLLKKTQLYVTGAYGKPEHYWQVNKSVINQYK